MQNDENENLNNNQTPNQTSMPNLNPEVPAKEEPKPIIEIPQEYYDKLRQEEQEKQEKIQKEHQENMERMQSANSTEMKGLGSKILICIIIIAGSIFASLNIMNILLAIIPVCIVVGSISFALKEKKESTFPTAFLIGGISVAVITFVISMLAESQSELMSHYALLSACSGFLGLILGGVITNLIANKEEVKAVGTLGALIFFAALIAIPYFAYQKYPEVVSKYLFLKQGEVKASTQEEFIERTLKNRYGLNITCDHKNKTNLINQKSQRVTNRTCSAEDTTFNVSTIAYNEGDNQYIVIDDLIDTIYLKEIKDKIATEIQNKLNLNKVEVFLYPERNCTFVGDCADSDEYYERYAEETETANQYKASTELNLEKYLNKNPLDFINEYQFKVIIIANGAFNLNADYNLVIQQILDVLNQKGLKNTYGFNISLLYYSKTEDLSKEIFKVKGQSNSSREFKEYEVLPLDGTKNNK